MSLNLYLRRSDCPTDMIDVNEAYFRLYSSLPDTQLVRKFLSEVDNLDYYSETLARSRAFAPNLVPTTSLSTGLKTILNVLLHPKECFTLVECGDNALRVLPLIQDGNAYWGNRCIIMHENYDCDIMCDGHKFSKFLDFLNYVRYDADLV